MTCAFAVRGALRKIDGVESVDVSLNKGLATVKLKPGNTIRPEQLWETVRRNGFTPKETRVTVRGQVIGGPTPHLTVRGTNQVFDLEADPKAIGDATKQIGKPVLVDGSLTPGKDLKQKVRLTVRAVRASI